MRVQQQDAVAHAGLVGGARHLEGHEPPVGRHHGVRGLPAFVVVEGREPGELAAGPVEAELPDVDVAEAGRVAERARLVIALHAGVPTVREDPLGLVVEADRGRLGNPLAGREVDGPGAGAALGFVAAVGQPAVVVEEVLGFEEAARTVAGEDDALAAQRRLLARDVQVGDDETRLALRDRVVLRVADREGDLRRSLRNGRTLAHPAADLHRSRPGVAAQEPQLVVSPAAAAQVHETLRSDQEEVRAGQVHDAQEGRARDGAGEAADRARLEVDHERVAEALRHEGHAPVVGREVGPLAEVGQHLHVRRQAIERAVGASTPRCGGHEQQREDGGSGPQHRPTPAGRGLARGRGRTCPATSGRASSASPAGRTSRRGRSPRRCSCRR